MSFRATRTPGLSSLVVVASLFGTACGSDDGPETFAGYPGLGGAASGGAASSGGGAATGGATTGGTTSTGGFVGSGGLTSSGGVTGSGGAATGGASPGGAGGASTGGASTGGTGTGGAGGADNRPPCMKNPNQVISIGDSYMNWGTHTFPADLDAAAGVKFRPTYAVGGFSMGSGGIGLIPPEFDQALADSRYPNAKDIIAVVMTGGGNDVLIPALGRPDCKNMANSGTTPGCQAIVTDALKAAETLMNKMVGAGVHDVIYYFYPHVPQPTLLGGSAPNAMLDYALPRVKEFCDSVGSKTQNKGFCHFVNLVPVFEGHSDWFASGDIHENSTGSKAIAKAVVDVMKAECIAQPASSGCCKP